MMHGQKNIKINNNRCIKLVINIYLVSLTIITQQ